MVVRAGFWTVFWLPPSAAESLPDFETLIKGKKMFKVSFKDVGKNRVTLDMIQHVKTLDEALSLACFFCAGALGRTDFKVVNGGEGEYILNDCGILLGSFTIVKQ